MAKITILCVGKVRESFYKDAAKEYEKRLSRYCEIEIEEVRDEPVPERLGDRQREQAIEREGVRLLSRIERVRQHGAAVVALAIGGGMESSESFAKRMGELLIGGKSQIAFVIGGSLGLSGKILREADWVLSFSRMTFPHQLMRVILLEQIYRAFKIMGGEPYHK